MEVILEGWLSKSPPISKLKSKTDWKKRYFKLLQIETKARYFDIVKGCKRADKLSGCSDGKFRKQYCLVYWKSGNTSPLRVINLYGCRIESNCDEEHWNEYFPHIFCLHTPWQRTFLLSVREKAEKSAWIDCLNEMITSADQEPVYESLQDIVGCNSLPVTPPACKDKLPQTCQDHVSSSCKGAMRRDSGYSSTAVSRTNSCYENIPFFVDEDIKDVVYLDSDDGSIFEEELYVDMQSGTMKYLIKTYDDEVNNDSDTKRRHTHDGTHRWDVQSNARFFKHSNSFDQVYGRGAIQSSTPEIPKSCRPQLVFDTVIEKRHQHEANLHVGQLPGVVGGENDDYVYCKYPTQSPYATINKYGASDSNNNNMDNTDDDVSYATVADTRDAVEQFNNTECQDENTTESHYLKSANERRPTGVESRSNRKDRSCDDELESEKRHVSFVLEI